jgi:hypothetical protein
MDSSLSRINPTPIHCRPDSERLLRTHNAWQSSWDQSSESEEAPDIEALIKEAFNHYASGLLPVQVRWKLSEAHPSLPNTTLTRIQRRAERALLAAESAPPELRRAMVAATRQTAIQGAIATRDWSMALKGLERAGEIAGETRESAGLSEEDLVLTVSVEAPAIAAGESRPVSGETAPSLNDETVEIEAESY